MAVFLNPESSTVFPDSPQGVSSKRIPANDVAENQKTGCAPMDKAMENDGVLYELEGVTFIVPDGYDSLNDYLADWREKHGHELEYNGPPSLKESCLSAGIGLNVTSEEWSHIYQALDSLKELRWTENTNDWLCSAPSAFDVPRVRQYLQNAGVSEEALRIGVGKIRHDREAEYQDTYLRDAERRRQNGQPPIQQLDYALTVGINTSLDDPNSLQMGLLRRIMDLDVSNSAKARQEFSDLIEWFGDGVRKWSRSCAHRDVESVVDFYTSQLIRMKTAFLG